MVVFYRELFGDGLIWAGCTLISLLGQQQRFEAFDHSYHLLKVNQVDGSSDKVNNIVSPTYQSPSLSCLALK